MATINGIYLPGWEYNRLLSENPLEPRNSALPGAVFWNGSAPLWMFEKIYCIQESLENERFASQEIGWATSQIFVQMAAGLESEGPILETVDWKNLNPSTRDEVNRVHKRLRKHGAEKEISRCIDDANDAELEHFKQALLRPIAASKRCVIAGSMSGLRHWLEPVSAQPETSQHSSSSSWSAGPHPGSTPTCNGPCDSAASAWP